MAKREWKTDQIEKFGDVASPIERIRHRLPPVAGLRHSQVESTPEILERRRALQAPIVKRVER